MAVSMTEYLDGLTAFVAAVPSVKTALRYSPLLDSQETPIALVQVLDMERHPEAGVIGEDGILMEAEVEVVILVKAVEREGYVTALEVAYDVAQYVHMSSLGMAVAPAEVEALSTAPVEPIRERWDGARLLFRQTVRLRNNRAPVETPENITSIFLGLDPQIGPPHVADYTEIKVDE